MRPDRRRGTGIAGAAVAATGLLALGVGLAGCGDDGPAPRPATVETARNGDVFNSADVAFATAMIPHHAQALRMALLAEDRPLEPELSAVVARIQDVQVPEVETMATWLTAWGKDVPATSMDHANAGHDAGAAGDPDDDVPGHDLPGMMSAARMAELARSSDADFAGHWLAMMIEHHEGAIALSETQRADGRFADAVALAGTIAEDLAEEVATLEELLGRR
ncbi:DUF305 domain-containing protein [Nocardioides sp. L-11A]|uniref:DUF305 domain-containing protein n=1 Tax=Nocardioides sp. L-11A TaxID=3043848 RepID=UPI00249BD8A7|nr:DUF305 domain-containing protein [Nocardioides sp. L-11A]